jgi:uncharacterized zinc-type alcohol dehydrogenase-like protein
MGHHGGFADYVIAQDRFVFPLPPELDSASAAPLFCGGATVYTPLEKYGRRGARVAVIGIGGLGHLAIQFASRMDCEVTAFSTQEAKKREAELHGARHFVVGQPDSRSFDLVLNTSTANVDMDCWLEGLRPEGVFVQLGAAPEPLALGTFAMIANHKTVAGSAVAHPEVLKRMLKFAGQHGVKAQVQTMPMTECNQALEITRSGSARYRVVLTC